MQTLNTLPGPDEVPGVPPRRASRWMALEGALMALLLLLLVTVAWINAPQSLARLALMSVSWCGVGALFVRGLRRRDRP